MKNTLDPSSINRFLKKTLEHCGAFMIPPYPQKRQKGIDNYGVQYAPTPMEVHHPSAAIYMNTKYTPLLPIGLARPSPNPKIKKHTSPSSFSCDILEYQVYSFTADRSCMINKAPTLI